MFRKNTSLTPQEKLQRKKDRLLVSLSGLLLGISFPPFPFFPLIFIAVIPYFFIIEQKEKLIEINRLTYLMGFVFSIISIYWVGAFTEMKDPFLMIAGIALLFFNPSLFMIPSTLYYFAKKNISKKYSFYFFPFFWVTYEYLYMITDLKFPWLVLGNSLSYFNLFIQLADIVGVLGITLIIVFINVLVFQLLQQYKETKKIGYVKFSFLILLFIIPLVYGISKTSSDKNQNQKVKVGLIQPNLDPYEKWSGGNLQQISNIYLELSVKAVKQNAKIVIWPETALPVYLLIGTYTDVLDSIKSFVKRNNIYLMTGMPDFRIYNKKDDAPSDAKYSKIGDYYFTTYNGIYLFSPKSDEVQKYGKMQLVPFGERTPFVDAIPFLGDLFKWGVGLSGWNVGQDTTVFTFQESSFEDKIDSIKFTGLVCYESIFPDFVASFTQKGSQFISVVTNDSWYGNTSGPYQHKEISVLRAIENRRYVVRAANGGISCIIDDKGNTISKTNMYERNVLVGEVSLSNELSFFSKNPKLIQTLSNIISFFVLSVAILLWLKKKLKMN